MATVGQQLTSPESGWRRYDDRDPRILSNGYLNNNSTAGYYGNTATIIGLNQYLRIRFYGSKIRLTSTTYNGLANGNIVKIDGQECGTINAYSSSTVRQVIVFEKLGLTTDYHILEINCTSSSYGGAFELDAIDTDSDGYLCGNTGVVLTSPESTLWRRYDDSDSRFIYTGNTWVIGTNASVYNGKYHVGGASTLVSDTVSFKFYGSKLRIIGLYFYNRSKNVAISIDGIIYRYNDGNDSSTVSAQTLKFEVLNLTLGYHNVTIFMDNSTIKSSGNNAYSFELDAIDIDSDGYLVHPILNQVSDINTMQIGDCIPCRYTATTSGQAGYFSELGTCIANEIPVTGSATPDGLFNFIKVAPGKLVADRVVQHSISWDSLNANRYIEGMATCDLSIPITAGWLFDENTGASPINLTTSATPTYTGTTALTEGNISFRRFNGSSDYITYNAKITPIGKKSIRFKVRTSTKPTSASWLIDNGNGSPNYGTTIGIQPTGKVWFAVNKGVSGSPNFYIESTVNICDGQWHDVLFTWDGTTNTDGVKLYLDNNITPNAMTIASVLETTSPLYNLRLGRSSATTGTTSTSFNGDLTIPEIYGELIDPTSLSENVLRTTTGGYVYDVTNKYTGTCTGTTIVTENGKSFRRFNGTSDYISFSNPVIPIGKKSIRFSIRTNQITDANVFANQQDGATQNGFAIWNNTNSKGLQFSIAQVGNTLILSTGVSISDGKWHDVLFTWDGTTNPNSAKVYVDDMSTPKCMGTPSRLETNNTSMNLIIGKYPANTSYNFNGDLSDIEIYNEVIDPTKEYDLSKNMKTRSLYGGCAYADANGQKSLTDQGKGAWPVNNEWDRFIVNSDLKGKITPGDDNIWHYSMNVSLPYTWCKETIINNFTRNDTKIADNTWRCARGRLALNYIGGTSSNTLNTGYGFRPVLTYVDNSLPDSREPKSLWG